MPLPTRYQLHPETLRIEPGLYAVSANLAYGLPWFVYDHPSAHLDPNRWGPWQCWFHAFSYFKDLTPIDRVGHSIFIYRITPDQALRLGALGDAVRSAHHIRDNRHAHVVHESFTRGSPSPCRSGPAGATQRSQGNAVGTPGRYGTIALKGRDRFTCGSSCPVPPFQGGHDLVIAAPSPERCPGLSCRASTGQRNGRLIHPPRCVSQR